MLIEVLDDPGTRPLIKDASSVDLKEMSSVLTRTLLRYPLSITSTKATIEEDLAGSAVTTIIQLLGSALSFSSDAAELRLSILECVGPSDRDIISFASHLLQLLRSNSAAMPDVTMLTRMSHGDRNELVKATLALLTNLLYRCTRAQVPLSSPYILLFESVLGSFAGGWRGGYDTQLLWD